MASCRRAAFYIREFRSNQPNFVSVEVGLNLVTQNPASSADDMLALLQGGATAEPPLLLVG